jgi:predicted DsbA family dithiol-disulfide isomerase
MYGAAGCVGHWVDPEYYNEQARGTYGKVMASLTLAACATAAAPHIAAASQHLVAYAQEYGKDLAKDAAVDFLKAIFVEGKSVKKALIAAGISGSVGVFLEKLMDAFFNSQ